MKILDFLKLPEAKEITDLDDPLVTLLHSRVINSKPFLKRLYKEFYSEFKDSINDGSKVLIELGSGGGFIKEVFPRVFTSDVISLSHLDIRFSALEIPFQDQTVDAYFMIDVLHHINDPVMFFRELGRSLKTGGKIVMIEPANTVWGRFIYSHFHHEPFVTSAGWGFEKKGPLTSANGALPWIIFCRDRERFERDFPSLKITKIRFHTPFRYLVSGGVSMRQMLPSFSYTLVKGLETALTPLNKYLGMFMTIELQKES